MARAGGWLTGLAAVPVAVAVTVGARWPGARLPRWIDLAPWRRWSVALVWTLIAITSVVQIGRLATAMSDLGRDFVLTTTNPFWHRHECFGAYLYAAEMSARGEPNVYDAAHYPGLDPEASPRSALTGVSLDDPCPYPLQFLLLPRLTLALTDDVATIRVVWFALQVTGFVAVAVELGMWVGGRTGRRALWLIPAVLASFAALHNFQFGQFHFPSIVLAVAGMLAVERRGDAIGGALLALAALSKVVPVVLLVYLIGRGRLRTVGWTVAWVALISAIGLGVLGPAPFGAFLDHQLPHLSHSTAFAFDAAWPELADLVVIDNQGVYGLARKAGFGPETAATSSGVFGLLVVAAAAIIGWRSRGDGRGTRAMAWLALLGLASLASPGAWGDYVPVTGVWLLTLAPFDGRASWRAIVVTAWVFESVLLGTMPIGDWAPAGNMTVLSAVGAVAMLLLFAGVLTGQGRRRAARRPAETEHAVPGTLRPAA